MNKKIIIALIVVLAIVAVGAFVLFSNVDQIVNYEETLNVSLPATFQTTEDESGLITEAFPENKTYVLNLGEESSNITASNIDSTWNYIKDSSSYYGDKVSLKDYTIGNNKYYDISINDKDLIQRMYSVDAQKIRFIDIVFPNVEKVYSINLATNDSSVDLDNADIQSIINSTVNS